MMSEEAYMVRKKHPQSVKKLPGRQFGEEGRCRGTVHSRKGDRGTCGKRGAKSGRH